MKITFILLLLILFSNHCFPQEDELNTVYVYSKLDRSARFKGGDEDLYNYISNNFHASFTMQGETGSTRQVMVLDFLVDTLGKISDIKFSNSIYDDIEREMKRTFEQMPRWKPAYKDGKKVYSRVYLPIRYIINENQFLILNSGNEMVVGNSHKNKLLKWLIVIVCVFTMYFFIRKGIP